ncbi:MAG: bifunctional DNA primase/polymerase [Clostridiales bacterium]|nr:bifunctional DNA primase/polymerase [Clostridiales bacterium]
MSSAAIRDAALQYARMGFRVIPVQGKTPFTKNGSYGGAVEPKQIMEWWRENPAANVAISTGKINNLICIDGDVDDEKGTDGLEVIRNWEMEHGALPDTWCDTTGRGGKHFLYRTNDRFHDYHSCSNAKKETGEPLGVDIRWDGTCFVAPPSIHANGHMYEWDVGGIGDEDTPIAEVDEQVDAFIRFVYEHCNSGNKQGDRKTFESPSAIPNGTRTETLFKMVCSLQSKGLSDEAIRAAVCAENEQKCVKPLTDKELEKEVFTALKRYDKGTLPCVSMTEGHGENNVFPMLAYTISYDRDGNEKSKKIVQSIRNMEIVLDNDKRFAGKIAFDEFAQQVQLMGDVPWGAVPNCRAWGNEDDSALFSILQSEYGLKNRQDYFDAVRNVAARNRFHPVRDMLDSFVCDGREHIRGLLPDYLGAENSDYNYQVMRLWMLGAVSRIYQPGCKFDYTLILVGKQGLGKSTFLNLLALDDNWFSDSLDSLDGDKAAQALAGSWIIELAELKSLARTAGGVDSVKRFLSAKQDKYRIPYERRTKTFLRQCVFAGTTNKTDFLQDETGNRRYLIVETGVNEPSKSMFKPEVMNDIRAAWAQAVSICKTEKPSLVLPESCREQAEQLQEESLADSGERGLIEEYLRDKTKVCAIKIWREAFKQEGLLPKWKAGEINSILSQLPDWEKMSTPRDFSDYGKQRGFRKKLHCSSQSDDGFTIVENMVQGEIPFD